jgi:hypothetical protein
MNLVEQHATIASMIRLLAESNPEKSARGPAAVD